MGKKHPWSSHGKVAGHGTKMSAFGRHFVQGHGAADTVSTPSSHENRHACCHRGTDFCDRVMGNDIAEHGVLCRPQALGLGVTAFKIFLIISGSQQFVFCLGVVLFARILGGVSWSSWVCEFIICIKLGRISAIIFPLAGTSITYTLDHSILFHDPFSFCASF